VITDLSVLVGLAVGVPVPTVVTDHVGLPVSPGEVGLPVVCSVDPLVGVPVPTVDTDPVGLIVEPSDGTPVGVPVPTLVTDEVGLMVSPSAVGTPVGLLVVVMDEEGAPVSLSVGEGVKGAAVGPAVCP
jgi:hypothetical protein